MTAAWRELPNTKAQNTLPEGGVQTLSHHAFVLMKLKPIPCTKKQIALPC